MRGSVAGVWCKLNLDECVLGFNLVQMWHFLFHAIGNTLIPAPLLINLRINTVNSGAQFSSRTFRSIVLQTFQVFSFCVPCLLTHLFVVKAVVRVCVRVLVGNEVSKAPHRLLCQPLSRVQIFLLRTMLLDHLSQSQSSSRHCEGGLCLHVTSSVYAEHQPNKPPVQMKINRLHKSWKGCFTYSSCLHTANSKSWTGDTLLLVWLLEGRSMFTLLAHTLETLLIVPENIISCHTVTCVTWLAGGKSAASFPFTQWHEDVIPNVFLTVFSMNTVVYLQKITIRL